MDLNGYKQMTHNSVDLVIMLIVVTVVMAVMVIIMVNVLQDIKKSSSVREDKKISTTSNPPLQNTETYTECIHVHSPTYSHTHTHTLTFTLPFTLPFTALHY